MYAEVDGAINSESPTWDSRLTPTRLTCPLPANPTTGTPIHNASQVVVVPL